MPLLVVISPARRRFQLPGQAVRQAHLQLKVQSRGELNPPNKMSEFLQNLSPSSLAPFLQIKLLVRLPVLNLSARKGRISLLPTPAEMCRDEDSFGGKIHSKEIPKHHVAFEIESVNKTTANLKPLELICGGEATQKKPRGRVGCVRNGMGNGEEPEQLVQVVSDKRRLAALCLSEASVDETGTQREAFG